MTKDVIVCKDSDSIKDAGLMMLNYDIGFLPVISNKKIMGVITDRDIAIYGIANDNLLVKDCLHKCLIVVNENDSIKKALDIMTKYKVKRLIVKNKKKMVGVISISDILNNYNKNKLIVEMFKTVYAINKNDDKFILHVDDFEL